MSTSVSAPPLSLACNGPLRQSALAATATSRSFPHAGKLRKSCHPIPLAGKLRKSCHAPFACPAIAAHPNNPSSPTPSAHPNNPPFPSSHKVAHPNPEALPVPQPSSPPPVAHPRPEAPLYHTHFRLWRRCTLHRTSPLMLWHSPPSLPTTSWEAPIVHHRCSTPGLWPLCRRCVDQPQEWQAPHASTS